MVYDTQIKFPKKNGKAVFGFADFLSVVEQLEKLDQPSKILLDLSDIRFAHPSGMAPIVAYSRFLHDYGWLVDMALPDDDFAASYFRKAGWIDGLEGNYVRHRPGTPIDTFIPLVSYNSHEELNPIVSDALRHFSRAFSFQTGVLDALEWALNEVADNVLLHAGGARGWVQLRKEPRKNLIEVVVVDCGRGVLDSLREGHPHLDNDLAALELAVEKGVTRDKNIGQGNGLAGTLRIAVASHGYVNLYSGAGLLRYFPTEDSVRLDHSGMPHRSIASGLFLRSIARFPGTVVTLTLPTGSGIDLSKALWGRRTMSMFENDYVSESGQELVYRLAQEASGFGNRPSARPLRTAIENLILQFPHQRLVIDFTGVQVVSASFADELVARLAKKMGVASFFQSVQIIGMNDFVRSTLDAVMDQRLRSD